MNESPELEWPGPVLVVPGLHGSGDQHWQTHWERRYPHFIRVAQADWGAPDVDRWARRIVETALTLPGPALVIAHSFGCLATVRAEQFQSQLIAGALLVAPADPVHFDLDRVISRVPLLFPSTLITSTDDPWVSRERAFQLSERWGSQFVDVGAGGHLNAQSGIGDWAEGLQQLDWLCRRMTQRARMMAA